MLRKYLCEIIFYLCMLRKYLRKIIFYLCMLRNYLRKIISALCDRNFFEKFGTVNSLWLPQVSQHVYMAVGLEGDAFFFQQHTLSRPAGGCAALNVHNAMAG